MSTRKPVWGLNPKILIWARERAGYSVEQAAQALRKDRAVLESWESGATAPTYLQLETLAYKVYKRPVALFFFPEPPDEPDPEHSFRTLPEFEIADLSPDTRYTIREARAMQLSLQELNHGVNPARRKIFRDLRASTFRSAPEVAAEARTYLGIGLKTQKAWRTADQALKAWRAAIEAKGVFVFKSSFKQREVSGFCLYEEEFPIIYLNNSTPPARQIFTLIHELGHLLFETDGVAKLDDRFIGSLTGEAKRIEVFCNQLAAEFLVPETDLRRRASGFHLSNETVLELAKEYKVSREVIMIRLLDLGLVPREPFENTLAQWRRESKRRSGADGGGNYYATQAAYLGESYLRLAFGRYYQGAISLQQLADFLNVKVSSIPGLEQFFLQKAAV